MRAFLQICTRIPKHPENLNHLRRIQNHIQKYMMNMKTRDTIRILRNLFTGLALLLMAAVQGVAQDGQAININGSFEDTEAGVVEDLEEGIEGWILELLGTGDATFEIVD